MVRVLAMRNWKNNIKQDHVFTNNQLRISCPFKDKELWLVSEKHKKKSQNDPT